jgi:hypothetical protein
VYISFLNETYSRIRTVKHLCDAYSIQNGLKQGDALSQFLLNFALDYAVRNANEKHVTKMGHTNSWSTLMLSYWVAT